MKTIIILGSARSDGNTAKIIQEIIGPTASVPLISLRDLNISPYDYEHHNQNDDFLPLMRQILEHDILVMATPVYWYTISAQLKVFIDRLTDLLTIEKEMGRQLRGKKLMILASCDHPPLIDGFATPLEKTAEYLGMDYLGCYFLYSGSDNALLERYGPEKARAQQFIQQT
jgi:putative NADPH-quinone reductase